MVARGMIGGGKPPVTGVLLKPLKYTVSSVTASGTYMSPISLASSALTTRLLIKLEWSAISAVSFCLTECSSSTWNKIESTLNGYPRWYRYTHALAKPRGPYTREGEPKERKSLPPPPFSLESPGNIQSSSYIKWRSRQYETSRNCMRWKSRETQVSQAPGTSQTHP